MESEAISFKVVILGSGRVGKTSLLLKYVRDKFDSRQVSTINAQFLEKKLTIDGKTALLHIWDTAGQEKFSAIAPIYYRKAAAALLVYDLTDPATVPEAIRWLPQLQAEGAHIVLVGNKADLVRERAVPDKAVSAQAPGLSRFYTSAKTGQGVNEVFTAVATALLKKSLTKSTRLPSPTSRKTLKLERSKASKGSSDCC